MLCVSGFIQSTITAIWRSNVVLIYSNIAGATRTVSMGSDPGKIIQSQGHSETFTVFLIQDSKNLKRGILQCLPPPCDSLCPASWGPCYNTASLRTEKLSFFFCSKRSCWMGVSAPGYNKDKTLLLILFPVNFSSRIVFYITTVTDIIKGLIPLPFHMPSWCFWSLHNAFKYFLWLTCKALLTVVPFQII